MSVAILQVMNFLALEMPQILSLNISGGVVRTDLKCAEKAHDTVLSEFFCFGFAYFNTIYLKACCAWHDTWAKYPSL